MGGWLITGAGGFVGRAVAAHLDGERESLVLLDRRRPEGMPPGAPIVVADLETEEPAELARRLAAHEVDAVIHCAGRTPPAPAEAFHRAHVGVTHRLVVALRGLGRPVRLVVVGSAAELGPVPADRLPVGEEAPCRPVDAYGLSKWAATRLALDALRLGLVEVVAGRLFNPTGPGAPAAQVFGRIARELARPGPEAVELAASDLDSTRDFLDVRDVAGALVALAREGRPGRLYHVGSGVERSIGEGLGALVRLSGRSVAVVAGRAAGRGPARSCADVGRIRSETSWRPRIDFERSLADLWDEARARAGAGPAPLRHVA